MEGDGIGYAVSLASLLLICCGGGLAASFFQHSKKLEIGFGAATGITFLFFVYVMHRACSLSNVRAPSSAASV